MATGTAVCGSRSEEVPLDKSLNRHSRRKYTLAIQTLSQPELVRGRPRRLIRSGPRVGEPPAKQKCRKEKKEGSQPTSRSVPVRDVHRSPPLCKTPEIPRAREPGTISLAPPGAASSCEPSPRKPLKGAGSKPVPNSHPSKARPSRISITLPPSLARVSLWVTMTTVSPAPFTC